MIVITGASGALNGATVDDLRRRDPGAEIVATVRDPDRAGRFADVGIEVRRADYADPASLPQAFAGADQLLLVSSSDPHSDAVELHRVAIDTAVAAGVGRILYTSHQGAAPDTPFGPGRDHFATEGLLEDSGVPWTSLRNGFYLHSLDWLLGPWRETGVIRVPLDGSVSWTDRADEAEAAAAILAAPAPVDGPVTLTAGDAPTFTRIAEIASEATGRPIGVEVLGEEAWLAEQIAAGRPAEMARWMLGMYEAANQGFFAGVDPALGRLLGREPRGVREFLAESGD